jgi:hypothetical protein
MPYVLDRNATSRSRAKGGIAIGEKGLVQLAP